MNLTLDLERKIQAELKNRESISNRVNGMRLVIQMVIDKESKV